MSKKQTIQSKNVQKIWIGISPKKTYRYPRGSWKNAQHHPQSEKCKLKLQWSITSYFILLDSKITADGNWSHEIKRRLLLGRKVMTNLGSILKSRDITLPRKVHLVKTVVFPVVMYECESWTIKKAEHWRIDAFELWC